MDIKIVPVVERMLPDAEGEIQVIEALQRFLIPVDGTDVWIPIEQRTAPPLPKEEYILVKLLDSEFRPVPAPSKYANSYVVLVLEVGNRVSWTAMTESQFQFMRSFAFKEDKTVLIFKKSDPNEVSLVSETRRLRDDDTSTLLFPFVSGRSKIQGGRAVLQFPLRIRLRGDSTWVIERTADLLQPGERAYDSTLFVPALFFPPGKRAGTVWYQISEPVPIEGAKRGDPQFEYKSAFRYKYKFPKRDILREVARGAEMQPLPTVRDYYAVSPAAEIPVPRPKARAVMDPRAGEYAEAMSRLWRGILRAGRDEYDIPYVPNLPLGTYAYVQVLDDSFQRTGKMLVLSKDSIALTREIDPATLDARRFEESVFLRAGKGDLSALPTLQLVSPATPDGGAVAAVNMRMKLEPDGKPLSFTVAFPVLLRPQRPARSETHVWTRDRVDSLGQTPVPETAQALLRGPFLLGQDDEPAAPEAPAQPEEAPEPAWKREIAAMAGGARADEARRLGAFWEGSILWNKQEFAIPVLDALPPGQPFILAVALDNEFMYPEALGQVVLAINKDTVVFVRMTENESIALRRDAEKQEVTIWLHRDAKPSALPMVNLITPVSPSGRAVARVNMRMALDESPEPRTFSLVFPVQLFVEPDDSTVWSAARRKIAGAAEDDGSALQLLQMAAPRPKPDLQRQVADDLDYLSGRPGTPPQLPSDDEGPSLLFNAEEDAYRPEPVGDVSAPAPAYDDLEEDPYRPEPVGDASAYYDVEEDPYRPEPVGDASAGAPAYYDVEELSEIISDSEDSIVMFDEALELEKIVVEVTVGPDFWLETAALFVSGDGEHVRLKTTGEEAVLSEVAFYAAVSKIPPNFAETAGVWMRRGLGARLQWGAGGTLLFDGIETEFVPRPALQKRARS
jgi:hypothetical protein